MSSCERAATAKMKQGFLARNLPFDDLAFRADGLDRVKDLSAARALLSELVQSGLALKASTIPLAFPLLRKSN